MTRSAPWAMTSCARASTSWPQSRPTTSYPSWSPSSRALPVSSRLTSAMWPSVCSMNTQMLCFSDISGLPDDVFVDQLRDHRLDSFGGGGDGLVLGALQDHEVDLVDLRGRARQPDAALGRADILGRPDGDLEIARREVGVEGLVRLEVGPARPDCGVLAGDGGELALHLAPDVRGARRVGRTDDGEQDRQRAADYLRTGVEGALGGDVGRGDLDDVLGVGDLRDAELLGRLRADLGGVAVDGLAAAQDEVELTELLDSALEDVGGGEGVRTGELAVRQQDDFVGSAEEAVAQDVGGLGRSHRDHGDRAAGPVLDLERHLKGVEVLGIEDRGQGATVHGAVFGHHLAREVVRIGDLFDQDHAMNRSRVGHQVSGDRPARGADDVKALPGLVAYRVASEPMWDAWR